MEVTGTAALILEAKGRAIYTISPEATVFEAIQELDRRNVGALLVMEGERLVGIFSERDYTRKVALQGRSSRDTRVREVITGRVVTVSSDTPVAECMRAMSAHRVRHLPVMDGDKVTGVISIGDLVNFIIGAQRATIEQLHNYIAGGYPG